MKANYKNRVSAQTQKAVEKAVAEEYERVRKENERKVSDRIEFMFILGAAIVAHEKLGYGPKRRKDFINDIVEKINEIAAYLAGNKVVEAADRKEHYDISYNREYLQKLADEYGVPFNEEVFDDVC